MYQTALSGFTEEQARGTARELVFDRCLFKPVKLDQREEVFNALPA